MIQKLSSGAAKWLEQEGAISAKDKELFSYAVYSLLFGLLPVFIITILGLAFGMLREGLLMIFPFMLIRKFSGGYHLNSPKLCISFSTALLTFSMRFIKIISCGGHLPLLTVLVALSVICLCAFSPVENSSRKLTKKERQLFSKISCILAIVALLGYLVMCETIPIQYSTVFGVGILLVAMLELPCVAAEAIGTLN